MLCKSTLMNNAKQFEMILNAPTPGEAKAEGQSDKLVPCDRPKWHEVVLEVAKSVEYQKFNKVPGLKEVLLGTGNAILAETTQNDDNWGIGIEMDDEKDREDFRRPT